MPPAAPIGEREHEILTALVETFIATGEPVGSRTLARSSREGLSPATIRNVMSDLADAGFLDQPHTSAGRIPSAAAYRYYVEQITGNARLSSEDENLIQEALSGVADVQEFMERTSHVLSLISHNVVWPLLRADPEMPSNMFTFPGWATRKFWQWWSPGRASCATGFCAWTWRRWTWTQPRVSSTRIFVAGPWRPCARSWGGVWNANAANTTA